MSPVDNSPRPATFTAIEDAAATVTSKAGFQAMLKQHQPLQSICDVLADRLRETVQTVNALKLTNFYYTLCSMIFHPTRFLGNRRGEQITVVLDYLLKKSCTILALQKELVEQVLTRLVFTRPVRIDQAYVTGAGIAGLLMPMSSNSAIGSR